MKTMFAKLIVSAGIVTAGSQAAMAEDAMVNVYTYREPGLIEPLLAAFTSETGIKTQVIFAKEGLEQRIHAEGANSPADVLLTIDIARLKEATDLGITQPVKSEFLTQRIPAELRDPDGNWFALSKRARVVYAAKGLAGVDGLTYEDLADPKWKGKICLRSGLHNYNNALFAAYAVHHGEAGLEDWLKGVKANLAQKPSGGDRDVARDIAAGKCALGLGNTYYVGIMANDPKNKAWYDAIKVVMPRFKDGGTHISVSGAAVAKHAPHQAEAVKLIEWLAGDRAQSAYASVNYEYPVVEAIAPSDLVASWGELKADGVALTDIASKKKLAADIVDRIAFDEGAD